MSAIVKYDTPYVLRAPYEGHPPGTVLYRLSFHDYGVAGEDSRDTGMEHTSMTLSPQGNYPGFTVPNYLLEEKHE